MSERAYDARTGRPLEHGREAIETLSDGELDVELSIAAVAAGRLRIERLARLRRELERRRVGANPDPPPRLSAHG